MMNTSMNPSDNVSQIDSWSIILGCILNHNDSVVRNDQDFSSLRRFNNYYVTVNVFVLARGLVDVMVRCCRSWDA